MISKLLSFYIVCVCLANARAIVPLEERTFLDTDANMFVTNDWPTSLSTSTSVVKKMADDFPSSLNIPSYSTTSSNYIKASWEPGQSSFHLNLLTTPPSYFDVDIGLTPYKTSVVFESSNPVGQAGAVLAPAKPLSSGTDFNFFFFGGPDIIPPLANSAITANLPAFAAYIAAHPMSFNLSSSIGMTIHGIPSTGVSCTYVAVSPATGDNVWNVNAILDISGSVTGDLTYRGHTEEFDVTVSDLSILVQAQVSLGNYSTISASVTRFQTSLGGVSLSGGNIADVIGDLYPLLAPVLKTPYTIAALMNQNYNADILSAINTKIATFLKSVVIPSSVSKRAAKILNGLTGVASKRSLSEQISGLVKKQTTDFSTWMSTSNIQAKTLQEIKIPGTHDSASYALQTALSLIQYPDIAFLWNFDYTATSAPVNGSNPLAQYPYYLGPTLGTYVLSSINRISRAQDETILQQLQGGVRYFDLRIYYDPADQTCYSQHGLKGVSLNVIVAQLQSFFTANPSAAEFVQLYVSHTNFGTYPEAFTVVTDLVDSTLKQWLYVPPSSVGVQNFDFQSLSDIRLSTITGGSNKVMLITSDYFSSDISVNSDGYASTNTNNSQTGLYQVSNSQALQIPDIVGNVLHSISGNTPQWALEQYALTNNAALPALLASQKGAVQLVFTDWYEQTASGTAPAAFVISMNN